MIGDPDVAAARTPVRGRPRAVSFAVWVLLFAIYSANRREIGAGDTVPAKLMALAICCGDGPFLDRFDTLIRTADGRVPGWAQESRGHIVSRYPIGPSLVAAPFVLPPMIVYHLMSSGQDVAAAGAGDFRARTAKHAAAAIMALAFVLLYHVLRGLRARSAWHCRRF